MDTPEGRPPLPLTDLKHALAFAEWWLAAREVVYWRCYAAELRPERARPDWIEFFDERGAPLPADGRRGRLWRFNFEIEKLPKNVVSTGNTFNLFVDAETGACGVWHGM